MKKLVIGILAHVDAGKTTLSEGMLYLAGKLKQPGRVDHGTAFLDTHRLEQERGITIFSKQALFSIRDLDVTLLDTPGHVDFSAEMERTLPVLDYAILVISGTDGVQAHTETLWRLLRRYHIPTFLFINKMDLPTPGQEELTALLKRRLDQGCVPFSPGVSQEEWAENIALCDDGLLEQYLEGKELTQADAARLIRERKLFPCYFGSALKLEGVAELLEGLASYTRPPVYPAEFGARVYKIARDPKGNRLTYLKVTGGGLSVRTPLPYTPAGGGERLEEKASQLRLYSGAKFEAAERVEAGSVCAVLGLSRTWPGQGLGAEPSAAAPVLESVLSYRILLPPDCPPRTILPKLQQLEEEDPQLHIVWDEQLGEIHARLMGQVQIEILKSLIRERFDVDVEMDAGRILYKETIAAPVEGVGHFEPLRHYAEVHLLLEPLEAGSGLVFAANCREDLLDRNWQRLVLTHLEEKPHLGVLTGSPITDMKITLIAGRAHVKHTEGGDFRQATYRALRQGLMQAESVLLEPWYAFRLEVPAEQTGRAISDLRAMCGLFSSPESAGENMVLTGSVPVSALGDYAAQVAAYTRGKGRLSCALQGYAPCHNAEQVIAQAGYDPEGDLANTPDSVFCAHGGGFVVKWDRVKEYMHLDSGLKAPPEEVPILPNPRVVARNLNLDDKELEAIMEREFGPIRRREYRSPDRARIQEPEAIPRKHYLIVDGYNIIFAWEDLERLAREDLDAARQRLIHILSNFAAYRRMEVVVVFDGYKVKGNPGAREDLPHLRLVYTKEGETGDMYIEKLVNEIGKNDSVRVATSDGLIQLSALRSGVLRMSAGELAEEIRLTDRQIGEILAKLPQQGKGPSDLARQLAAYRETQEAGT